MIAEKHPCEAERLRSLRAFDILDSAPEKDFDDIVKLAAAICGADASTITLIDADRQWFKAATGMPEWVAPLDLALCAHTVIADSLVEIPDTLADPRTADNPLCTAEGGCRFYAGAQLTPATGLPLGTLCVLGFRPHRLNDLQREALRVLANQVMRMLELRQALKVADVLRQEVDHRVKNSLQSIAAFTSMQVRAAANADAGKVLEIVQRHLQSVAALHDLLHRSEAAGKVDLAVYLRKVVDLIAKALPQPLRLDCAVDSVEVSSTVAAKAALIVNEFATNSMKHGFPGNRAGAIRIDGHHLGKDQFVVRCSDKGIGNAGASPQAVKAGRGLKIIEASAAQMQGSVTWTAGASGFALTLTFPVET